MITPRNLIQLVIFFMGFASGFSLSYWWYAPNYKAAYEKEIRNIQDALNVADIDLRNFDSGRLPDDFYRD